MSMFLDDCVLPICMVHDRIDVNELNITSCDTACVLKQLMLLNVANWTTATSFYILLNFISEKKYRNIVPLWHNGCYGSVSHYMKTKVSIFQQ